MAEVVNTHPRDWAHDSGKVFLSGIIGVAIIIALFFTYFKSRPIILTDASNGATTSGEISIR